MYKKFLEKLEYNLIKEKLASFCKTFDGKNKATQLEPDSDQEQVQKNLDETNALIELSSRLGNLPISSLDNLAETLKRVESQSPLTIIGLLQMLEVLKNSHELSDFYSKAKEDNLLSTNILDNYFYYDKNGDCNVSKNEWMVAFIKMLGNDMPSLEKEGPNAIMKKIQELSNEFDSYDTDKNGYLEFQEFKKILRFFWLI